MLTSKLNDANQIVFMDFEGTQLTQEIIAIGAIKADLDNKKQIKKLYKPFKVYVISEGVVGPFVENLTGITDLYLFQYDFQSVLLTIILLSITMRPSFP